MADDVTVIVLSNNESNSPVVSRALADIVFGKAVVLPRKRDLIQVASTLLDTCVGVYEGKFSDDPKATFTVTRTGNQLFEQLTGGKKKAIFPETETTFFFKATDARLEFIRDASGKVVKRRLTYFGWYFDIQFREINFQVIWSLGISMIFYGGADPSVENRYTRF